MITLKNISKYYKDTQVINNFSITLNNNTTTALLGTNGAGKTTLIKLLTCQLYPDAGQIFFNDLNTFDHTIEILNQIGYVSEIPNFYENWTVKKYLRYCGQILNIKNERIEYLLELLSLKEISNKKIKTLSKGFRQRLAFAQCILHDPNFIILDEPFSSLDPLQKQEIYSILELFKGKKTIIFSTHQISDIKNICDKVLILDKGKIIYNDSYSNEITKFFNETKINQEI